MARIVGAVLAAGSGSRIGTPKASILLDGQRLVDWPAPTRVHAPTCLPIPKSTKCAPMAIPRDIDTPEDLKHGDDKVDPVRLWNPRPS